MLLAHRALEAIHILWEAARLECGGVLEIGKGNDDVVRGCGLEAESTVPGHVLDCEEGAVSQDIHVQVAVGSVVFDQ